MRLSDVSRRDRGATELSLGPLLDIVFLLLIFFVVTSTFSREESIPLTRPEAQSGVTQESKALRVALSKSERIFVEGTPVQVWSLKDEVRRRMKTLRISEVLVVADRDTRSEMLVSVVDQCRLAGADDVAVAVEGQL